MPREILHHVIDEASAALLIEAVDEPGHGGASHEYAITTDPPGAPRPTVLGRIFFQNGPILEHGLNGVTGEALLAIVIDRLDAFQAGPFACHENAMALASVKDAMGWLHHRTAERAKRGVEGTSLQ